MRPLRTRHWTLLGAAAAAAVLFSGLGAWQLGRHEEQGARNDTLRSRLQAPPLDGSVAPLAGDSLAWRRARVAGRYDHAREILLRGRAYEGTPGVYVTTPLRREDAPAVLVVRGWMPAADGVHAPLSRGRPPPGGDTTLTVTGVLLAAPADARAALGRDTVDGEPHLLASHVAVSAIADSLPYPVAPLYLQRTDSAADADRGALPVALSPPSPEPGPHLWYALQWFGLAAIAAVGTGAYLYTELREGPGPGGRTVDPGRARPGPAP